MTPFNNPIAGRKLPKHHEASQMDSARERDATGKQWIMSRTSTSQLSAIMIALNRVQIELGKLRRRITGGGSSTSTGMVFKGEYDSTKSYSIQNVVVFTNPGGSAGTYIALQTVSAGVSPDVGSPSWFAFPNSPPSVWA